MKKTATDVGLSYPSELHAVLAKSGFFIFYDGVGNIIQTDSVIKAIRYCPENAEHFAEQWGAKVLTYKLQ